VEGFPGDSAQTGKAFAHSLASGDFDSDGHADLVLGSPQEDEPGIFDAGAETVLYGAIFADGVENGNAGLWSQVQPSAAIFGNRVFAATGAKLGPPSSKLGLQVSLSGTVGPAAFVRVGPDRGFHDERLLSGTLFIDPQSLTMSSAAGANVFQMVAFSDSLGAGARTRLAFDLVRTATNYSLVANFHDDGTNALQFAGSGVIADAGDPNGHNTRLDYEWQAGNPGHLTMWKTRFVGGFPDASGRVQLFSVDLPNMGSAVVNHVLVGMISGQDVGTTGALFFDELSFRR
jgi:hypothetical protein